MVMPSLPVASGAAISSAVRYWLLTAPLSSTCHMGIGDMKAESLRACTREKTNAWHRKMHREMCFTQAQHAGILQGVVMTKVGNL